MLGAFKVLQDIEGKFMVNRFSIILFQGVSSRQTSSLKEVKDRSEGASRDRLLGLCKREGALLEFWRKLLPIRVVLEIFVHPLVTEEQVFIAPVGGDHLRCSLDLSDLSLGTTKLFGIVHGIHSVKDSARFYLRKILHEVYVTFLN